ncbi:MAG: response regulator transcription factor [Gammaproteobacteria bacterium]|nr:response regulator transcription factor [Gammaproteobacteria bacterium]
MKNNETFDQLGAPGLALVIEDHPLYRDALRILLSTMLGETNVIAVSTVEEGLRRAVPVTDVRLVMLDVGLPGVSGTEAVTVVRRACTGAALIVISASEDRRDVAAAFRAGAQLFVSKTIATEILADLVRSALAGHLPEQPAWISPFGEATFLQEALPTLTPRQRQILGLLNNGCSNKEIGSRLGLAEVTVKMHVSSIFRSLGVASRTQAILAAHRLGLHEATGDAGGLR